MEITFTRSGIGETEGKLIICQSEENVSLQINFIDYANQSRNYEAFYIFEKGQLHDFIGALLHVQQKTKGGK